MSEKIFDYDDSPHEECGVFGIYAPGEEVAALTYDALLSLQHRGQEAAGVAINTDEGVLVVKGLGWVRHALHEGLDLADLKGADFASGHVRYSTVKTESKKKRLKAAQPMLNKQLDNQYALSHNGNLINRYDCVTDSQYIVRQIDKKIKKGFDLSEAVPKATRKLRGAFSLIIMGQDKLIGLRDPNGFRPLVLGSLSSGGKAMASEVGALNKVGATFDREIKPGEMVEINEKGIKSLQIFDDAEINEKLCAFEYIYFSFPDNELQGQNVDIVRRNLGIELAKNSPVDADIVMGVPQSGISAGQGYAKHSGIDYIQGLLKNQYVGRSFITAGQSNREKAVREKLSVNQGVVNGKRLVIVDDSIIRGTTTRTMVAMFREAGATEVHLRISSPPYRWPCFYGMDTSDRSTLIASRMTEEDIKEEIGADSLAYLTLDSLHRSVGSGDLKICDACLTGEYPTEIPVNFLKRQQKSVS